MAEKRPRIPEDILRAVRQRDGFGCIFCGNMIVEYEHIIPYAKCNEHTFDNITLLCNNCHGEVTTGRRSKDMVLRAQARPFCRERGNHPSYVFAAETQRKIAFGGNCVLVDPGVDASFGLIRLSAKSYINLSFQHGVPFIDARIPGIDGKPALVIKKNRITLRRNRLWDARLVGKELLVRLGHRRQLVKAQVDGGQFTFEVCRLIGERNAAIARAAYTRFLFDNNGGESSFGLSVGIVRNPSNNHSFIAAEGESSQSTCRLSSSQEPLDSAKAWKWLFSRKDLFK